MTVSIILCVGILVLIASWLRKHLKNYVRSVILATKVAGLEANSIFGNIDLLLENDRIVEVASNASSYGSIFRGRILTVPVFFIYEPEHLRVILGSSKVRSDKNFVYSLAEKFLGNGLITNNGLKWKMDRKLIQPYFHVNLLQKYFGSFLECAKDISQSLSENEYVNITKFVNLSILKSLYKEILGIHLDNLENNPFRCNSLNIFKRISRPWLIKDYIYKKTKMFKQENDLCMSLRDCVTSAVNESNRRRIEGKQTPCCMTDMFLKIHEENPDEFTEEDVVNEAITFMLAGQDSTATFISICVHYIAKYPTVQEKIYGEVKEIFVEDHCEDITVDQLNRMVYLKQCIKEIFRLTPTVPLFMRVLKDDVELGGLTIPASSNICISPMITHRLEKYFPNPLQFDPERFSPENIKKIHPFAYLPFSLGPRNCIGSKYAMYKAKIILATIIRKYQLRLKPGTEDLHFKYNIVLKAKGGIWIKAKLRK